MSNNSTQQYIDGEKSFLNGILKEPLGVITETLIEGQVGDIDIDLDIEKKIRQLQEQKFEKGIKNVLPKEIDILENKLGSFLSSVQIEKKQLEENVKQKEINIEALENLFSTLTKEKEKVSEEIKVDPEEEIKEDVIEVSDNKIKEEVKTTSGILDYLIPKKVEYEEGIIDKVYNQISEMKVANNLEKEKISKLRSIDTLDKLTEEFLRFRNITSVQLSTLDNDDVDISSIGDGKILEYNSTTKKMEFVSSGDSVNNLEVLGSITFEGSTANDFETTFNVIDPTADRTISLPNVSGTLPVLAAVSTTQITATPEELNFSDGVTGNIQTQLDAKSTKAFAIAQAVALG